MKKIVDEGNKHEILIMEIVLENCKKKNGKELSVLVNEELFCSKKKFDIRTWFQENQRLLNYKFEPQKVSIEDFELYCFY